MIVGCPLLSFTRWSRQVSPFASKPILCLKYRAVLLALFLCPSIALAQLPVAPYVSTPEADVEQMLDMAAVAPGDYLIDLGSGDGRIVIAAARRGARAHGVELDPELVQLARQRAQQAGVAALATFSHGDAFEADLSAATVVTLYLLPEVNIALKPKLLEELSPGARVISGNFDMGRWVPDRHQVSQSSGGIYLWHIPLEMPRGLLH